MSVPLKPTPDEYTQQLAAWKVRIAESLGLDPGALLDIDTEDQEGATVVKWRAVNQDAPKVGNVSTWGISSDGEFTEFFGHAFLDEEDGDALFAAAGAKPQAPWEEALQRG